MTKPSSTNQGIQVFGGSFEASQVAVGNRAQASQVVHGTVLPEEVQSKWEALSRVLAEHADKLEGLEHAEKVKTEVATELAKPKPDKSKILGGLEEFASIVSSATGIATAVEALKQAVILLL